MNKRTAGKYVSMATFLLPAFALIVIFSYYPALSGILHSFTNWDIGGNADFIGITNYVEMWKDAVFVKSMLNALRYAVFHVVVNVSVPVLVALLIFHLRTPRSRYLYRVLFLIPAIIPGIVTYLIWGFIYAPYDGILNTLLELLRLGDHTRAWLGDPETALYAIFFIGFPFVSAFNMLIIYAGLTGIGTSVFDAAEIDGAGVVARLLHIELPLIRPQIMLVLILSLIGGFSSYDVALILTQGGPMNATMLPGLYMYRNAFQFGKMGYASAMGTLLFVLLFILAIFSQRYRRQT